MAPARDPRRRSRPRLQQRQHLRQPAAADARGWAHARRRGSGRFYELALKCPAPCRRRAGPGIGEWRRLHLLVQRAPLAVRRHDPLAARRLRSRINSATSAAMSDDERRSPCSSGCSSTRGPRPATTSTTARGATPTTSAAASPTRAIFNVNDGSYRCPSTQQGYSPFTTWTRGLAWVMLGLRGAAGIRWRPWMPPRIEPNGGRVLLDSMLEAARGSLRLLHRNTRRADGIPYWDTGAPGLARARGLSGASGRPVQRVRAGRQLRGRHRRPGLAAAGALPRRTERCAERGSLLAGRAYGARDAAGGAVPVDRLRRTRACCSTPSTTARTAGIYVPRGRKVPCGESSMWGDYHMREAALYVQRLAARGTLPKVFLNPETAS